MTRKKPEQLEVIRNPNYTISVVDGMGRVFIFSDICGSNLELLESILNPEATEKEEPISVSMEGIVAILNLLNTQEFAFIYLPRRIIFKIFSYSYKEFKLSCDILTPSINRVGLFNKSFLFFLFLINFLKTFLFLIFK